MKGQRRLFLLLSCCLFWGPALAQAPGCYTPKFSLSDEGMREQNVQTAEKHYGAETKQVADALVLLSDVYREMHAEKAAIALTRALKIREKVFGVQSKEAAETKVLIADCLEAQGQYSSAEPLLKESLATTEHLYGKNDRRLISILYHLANCYISGKPNRAGDAVAIISRAQNLADTAYGANSAHSYQLLGMLSCAYRSLGNNLLAQQTNDRAQKIIEKLKNPFVGEGTARRLELDPILAAEDARAASH
jgi:tetratricopeptide (TPR) repeat protein